ncbi:MAG: selenium cofactor biosynthesis protein YqeC [Anaerolineaceae bacterium]|nr:selenium cofactor biosynthesis protein YqeC [Anaerolineaceae bacterium]
MTSVQLEQALRITPPLMLALSGAGGKTSIMMQLARQIPGPVVITSTTHLAYDQVRLADRHVIATQAKELSIQLADNSSGSWKVLAVTGAVRPDQRSGPLSMDMATVLQGWCRQHGYSLLVEADGSRRLPLKAPAAHEPVIPAWSDPVVVSAGLSGLEKTLSSDVVHRPEQFARLSGLQLGNQITPEALGHVLAAAEGGKKGIPAGARCVAFLNHANDPSRQEDALVIAGMIRQDYDAVVICAQDLSQENADTPAYPVNIPLAVQRVIEPAAGIVLAAGGSSRYGQPKFLLPWQGQALIRSVVIKALESGLDQVIVVVGAVIEAVQAALSGLPVQFVINPDWQEGQSTSIRRGLELINPACGAAVFLLADQPFLSAELIRRLIERHQAGLPAILAPQVNGRRANPVLFDRRMFDELRSVHGDVGGRALFQRYGVEYLDWPDERLLLDIDTPQDYERSIELSS